LRPESRSSRRDDRALEISPRSAAFNIYPSAIPRPYSPVSQTLSLLQVRGKTEELARSWELARELNIEASPSRRTLEWIFIAATCINFVATMPISSATNADEFGLVNESDILALALAFAKSQNRTSPILRRDVPFLAKNVTKVSMT